VSPPETQPQRTVLSWQRTGLGVLGIAALLAHAAVVDGGPLPLVLAAVVALTGLGVLTGLAPARARGLTRAPAAAPRAAALVTAAVVVTALAAAAALLSR
jgi:putative membrane protein